MTQNPGPTAYCGAISGVCVGIPFLSTKTYDLEHALRTLADSEAVALVHSVISYYEGIAKSIKSVQS